MARKDGMTGKREIQISDHNSTRITPSEESKAREERGMSRAIPLSARERQNFCVDERERGGHDDGSCHARHVEKINFPAGVLKIEKFLRVDEPELRAPIPATS